MRLCGSITVSLPQVEISVNGNFIVEGLRESPGKAAVLAEFDTFNLLANVKHPEPKELNTIDDVLEDDALGLIGGDVSDEADPNDIFILRNVPKSINMPDHRQA